MAFDWKSFQNSMQNPLFGSYETHLQHQMQSQLSRQAHEQRLKEGEVETEQRRGLADFEYEWREKLAKINTNLERSLAVDANHMHLARIRLSDMLESGQRGVSHENAMELARYQADAGLRRANVYKQIAEINNQLRTSARYDPDAPLAINQNTYGALIDDYGYLGSLMTQNEAQISSIQANPLYQKSQAGEFDEFDTSQMQWFKEQNDTLIASQKNLRDARRSYALVTNEIIKFAFDAKQPNPLDETQALQMMQQVGVPIPQGYMRPKSGKGLSEHMEAIEDLVIKGWDLPSDQEISKQGYDITWMKANWPQYRDFYRQRVAANITKFMAESMLDEPTQWIKNLSKIAATIFSK